MTWRRGLVGLVAVAAVAALAVYAWASWMLFDEISRVDPHCGFFADGSARFGEYTPASFGTAGVSDDFTASRLDTADVMPAYEEVRFTKSRRRRPRRLVPADGPNDGAVILDW